MRDSQPLQCEACNDTGTEVTESGARVCKCRSTGSLRLAKLLDRIPPRYQGVTLAGLQPRADLHPNQPQIIEFMRAQPEVNYYLCGNNDTGKSHLLWALYQHAVISGYNVFATSMFDFIEGCKDELMQRPTTRWQLPVDRLKQQTTRYRVFLDDIDKARATEYVAETFFNFIDTIYAYRHQLVVTSQLDPERRVAGRDSLIEHFESADPRYAVGIVRRIVNDETAIWRMF